MHRSFSATHASTKFWIPCRRWMFVVLRSVFGGSSLVISQNCQVLLNQYERSELAKTGSLSLPGFRDFLMSQENDIFVPVHRTIYQACFAPAFCSIDVSSCTHFQEMTLSMSHYYINTSHNSYLTGSQLNSKSTVETYRQQLLLGCRCGPAMVAEGADVLADALRLTAGTRPTATLMSRTAARCAPRSRSRR